MTSVVSIGDIDTRRARAAISKAALLLGALPTAHYRTARRRCGSSGDAVRSVRRSIAPSSRRLPAPSRSPSQTARRSLRRAVWRNPRACPQPLCSWRRANPGGGSTAAPQHAHALPQWLPPSALSSQPARPLARRTLRRTFLLPSAAAPTTTSHRSSAAAVATSPLPSVRRSVASVHNLHQPFATAATSPRLLQSLACCAAVPAHPSSSFRCSRPAALVPTVATVPHPASPARGEECS